MVGTEKFEGMGGDLYFSVSEGTGREDKKVLQIKSFASFAAGARCWQEGLRSGLRNVKISFVYVEPNFFRARVVTETLSHHSGS